jgi:hypothetical protein
VESVIPVLTDAVLREVAGICLKGENDAQNSGD